MFFLLMAAMAFPAAAAKRETVAQLEQSLSAQTSAHKSDADIARQIRDVELTERLSDASLARLGGGLAKDSQAAVELKLLAEKSAFADLPANELPATAAPDDATQRRMLSAARTYVGQTLPRLPNFLATRTINRYDDSPQIVKKGGWPVRAGLHQVDTSSREVSVRDERENQPPTQGSAVWKEQIGLISGGEFGSTLGMILSDTAQGKITWSHWEEMPVGTAAVFNFSVPKAASHFEILGTLQREASLAGAATTGGGGRGVASIGVRPNMSTSNTSTIRTKPGYHGSLWIDSASGTILRITMAADQRDSVTFKVAEILVQYGPVAIAESTYICPVRSLAISVAANERHGGDENAPTQWLNETLFTGYHRFASTTQIVPEPETPK